MTYKQLGMVEITKEDFIEALTKNDSMSVGSTTMEFSDLHIKQAMEVNKPTKNARYAGGMYDTLIFDDNPRGEGNIQFEFANNTAKYYKVQDLYIMEMPYNDGKTFKNVYKVV